MSDILDISDKQLISVHEAADILGISYRTVYRMVEDRRIGHVRIVGQKKLWKHEVEAFLVDNYVAAVAQ